MLVGQRLESNGDVSGDPIVILDLFGARIGSTVIVSTDGDLARAELGNTTPIRMSVVGIVDTVHVPGNSVGRHRL